MIITITFLYRQNVPIGVSRIGYAKSNANTFVRARAYRVFLTSCDWINLGNIPRGLRHPRDVPSVGILHICFRTYYGWNQKWLRVTFSAMNYGSYFACELWTIEVHIRPKRAIIFCGRSCKTLFCDRPCECSTNQDKCDSVLLMLVSVSFSYFGHGPLASPNNTKQTCPHMYFLIITEIF